MTPRGAGITRRDLRRFYASAAWREARGAALHIHGRRCAVCGRRRGPFEIDHRIPLRAAWAARLMTSNLQVLCRSCHVAKRRQEREWERRT